MAAARRLRGEVVRALQDQPLRAPTERIRLAELTLDSDQTPDVELLVTAARDAIALTNVTLGERLARAAVNRGGGLVASELLARSLLWQGKAAEAEETLSLFDPDQMNELELVRWGLAADRQPAMVDGRRRERRRGAGAVARAGHPPWAAATCHDGVASASRLFENQLEEAVAHCPNGCWPRPAASAAAVEWAVFGGALALALMGRADEVAAVAERGHADREQGRRAAAVSHRVRRGSRAGAGRRLRLRRKTIRRHRADHLGRPVPGVGHGQRARRHRRAGPRTASPTPCRGWSRPSRR